MNIDKEDFEYLKNDKFYLFYEMMMQALKTDDVVDGINLALFLLKFYLSSGNVVLYKKDDKRTFVPYICDSSMKKEAKPISCIINKTASLIRNRGIMGLDLNLSDDYRNMMFIYLKTKSNEYILSINNYYQAKEKKEDISFFGELKDTVQIILKRAESYEKNKKAINTDMLTGLDNRNSYEQAIQSLDDNTDGLVYGIFDLFRLKYVNDNYSHSVGDKYIVEVAKILEKYWPKHKVEIIDNEQKIVDSGHCVYRIGGDEFVLLAKNEPIELTRLKALLAAEEVRLIDLGIDEKLPLGLNSGIIKHVPGESIKNTYQTADEILSSDKKGMYMEYGLERRR